MTRPQDMPCISGGLQLGGAVPRWREEVATHASLFPRLPFMFLLPRSKAKMFEDGRDRGVDAALRNLLPHYLPASEYYPGFANFEGYFYVDIATQIGGAWKAQRKLTAVVWDQSFQPVAGRLVSFKRAEGSTHFKFVASDGTEKDELKDGDAVQTDEAGMAEITVRHPAREVDQANAAVKIVATSEGDESFIILQIVRNSHAPALDDVGRKNLRTADRLYVYQPDAPNRTPLPPTAPLNQGVLDLQEMLNEVVSRNRRVPAADWRFVPLDGQYTEKTRDAVKLYLQHFTAITAGANWPYNLANIGLATELVDYLKTEYLFDPTHNDHKGKIVDRRVLIGETTWDIAPASIDGLWELYEGVVKRLQSEMVRVAELYVNESTFWLHRPLHSPYLQSNDWVFRVHQANTPVRTAPNNTAPMLTDPSGNAVTVGDGELFARLGTQGAFTQIQHPSGNGWVATNSGSPFRDDQSIPRNSGLHGFNGVAYSFGAKCRPDEYRADLLSNPHAPPDDAAGNLRRIASWEEYANEHKPGLRGTGSPIAPEESTANWTGCDCSGFTQNCITEALFDGTTTRVVPANILARLTRSSATGNGRIHQGAIASGSFVGDAAVARPVPLPESGGAYDEKLHWIRKGDVIAGGGHIVWVSEDKPAIALSGTAIAYTRQVFLTYNERGDTADYDANFNVVPAATARFTRKAINQPFRWWGAALNARNVGKPFIWR